MSGAPTPAVHDSISLDGARRDGEWLQVCPSARIAPRKKLLVRLPGGQDVMLMRGAWKLYATQGKCCHLDVSLLDGYHDDQAVYCPAHGVAFSPANGTSSCEALTLRTYEVREEDGAIWLRQPCENGHV